MIGNSWLGSSAQREMKTRFSCLIELRVCRRGWCRASTVCCCCCCFVVAVDGHKIAAMAHVVKSDTKTHNVRCERYFMSSMQLGRCKCEKHGGSTHGRRLGRGGAQGGAVHAGRQRELTIEPFSNLLIAAKKEQLRRDHSPRRRVSSWPWGDLASLGGPFFALRFLERNSYSQFLFLCTVHRSTRRAARSLALFADVRTNHFSICI